MRLQAEALLLAGDLAQAEQSARSAAEHFGEMRDHWAQADSRLLLGITQVARKQRPTAQVSLLMALEGFERSGDHARKDQALALLAGPSLLLAGRTAASRIKLLLLRRARVRPRATTAFTRNTRRARLAGHYAGCQLSQASSAICRRTGSRRAS
jgi:hypothetical protein